ncbi:MBOAT family protein [bacterium]|nr:MBOAT family protein [bacterium]
MLFNSFTFLLFFLITYSLYIVLRKHLKGQNILLLVASYVFYGYWDWRFLSLIILSTIIDYFVGLNLDKSSINKHRKILLTISVLANLSILSFFKYFNFFAESFSEILALLGMSASYSTLKIVLPVGISFYTFQTMSYTIDIYRKKLKPIRDFSDFALFVSFFPQLVAGPIERASNLLPQIIKPRTITLQHIHSGIFLILWGFFKKVIIADNLALVANNIFNNYSDYTGLGLFVGVLAFTFQIYGDFSGYSDIARGISRLLGFELMLNFRLPYFAVNPSDFWLRWHISLSSWLRDYLYIPLGGSRGGSGNTYRNLMLTMLLGGLWHGAAWNFVIWGAYHGAILVIYRLLERGRELPVKADGSVDRAWLAIKITFMFILTMIGWILFRAHSYEQIMYFMTNMFSFEVSAIPSLLKVGRFILPLVIIQILQHRTKDLLIITKMKPVFLGLFYLVILFSLCVFSIRESVEFIYFQF